MIIWERLPCRVEYNGKTYRLKPSFDRVLEAVSVFGEAEIEVEGDGEIPEVTAVVEEMEYAPLDAEITELLESIPMVDEEQVEAETVDAIDVTWEEANNKTYKYDPDGNEVDCGDIVLVPTIDEDTDKEIIREAEVLRGNYRVETASLDHPLRKIIGVVRRRATKVFTAMINSDEEKDQEI